MTEQTRLAGEPITELQLQMAKKELLDLAREKMAERGCSMLEAMGLVDAELRQRIRNEESIGRR